MFYEPTDGASKNSSRGFGRDRHSGADERRLGAKSRGHTDAVGGPIGLLRTGDVITIDAVKQAINAQLSATELRRRRAQWHAPKPYAATGVLMKYARLVGSASDGAVTGAGPGEH